MSICFDEGPDHFVPETQIEREIRARPPVVLDEEARFASAQRDSARTVLHRGLLREPEQEVREVISADTGAGCSARRVEPREDERALSVRIGIAARAIEAHVTTHTHQVLLIGMHPAVGEQQAAIGSVERYHVVEARQTRERERRDAPIEGRCGHAGDAGHAGDVDQPRVLIGRSSAGLGDIEVDAVHRPFVTDIQGDRRRQTRRGRPAAQRGQHVHELAIATAILELRGHRDARSLLRLI